MYQPRRPSQSTFVPVRNLRYHVRTWGDPDPATAPLVMVHGWMDVGASYQFVVDALERERWVIAPDWRGYGRTAWVPEGAPQAAADNYWFPDYLADLDILLDHFSPDAPVDLVGHSMGGNVAMLYGGVRPQRIRRLVNLEGFGMPNTQPSEAPGRYARWIDEVKSLHRGEMALATYDGPEGVARRLMKTNPRLGDDKAQWLARQWAAPDTAGRWAILGDAAHKIVNAQLYRVDEVLEIYRRIAAPVLWVEASDNSMEKWWQGRFTLEEFRRRLEVVPRLRQARIEYAGHMLHHDQPAALAREIDAFLA